VRASADCSNRPAAARWILHRSRAQRRTRAARTPDASASRAGAGKPPL